ncbi:hypothetical protein T190115A13A_70079 [Tenacibaculum sp. 190524A02b]|uniref:Transposase n=1 Tax=Tenacibaculum vairaonense TaxID=3137860 RepID=A0ABP1FD84_9FLAO
MQLDCLAYKQFLSIKKPTQKIERENCYEKEKNLGRLLDRLQIYNSLEVFHVKKNMFLHT